MTMRVDAPWTEEQQDGLRRWQKAGYVHELTCGGKHCRAVLDVLPTSLVCRECGYVQRWAPAVCVAGAPPNPFPVDPYIYQAAHKRPRPDADLKGVRASFNPKLKAIVISHDDENALGRLFMWVLGQVQQANGQTDD